jgi:hypothetical protein
MLALVAAEKHGDRAGSSPWEREIGPAAMGNIFGATIDDAAGAGGMGLSGPGEGGGGKGAGVKLDGVFSQGSCGQGCAGRLSARHDTRTYSVHFDDGYAMINGRLMPESIQRVVRENHGRMRACYQSALLRDPGLEGRVAVKFVIDRSGAVAMASAAEHSFPDESVPRCVARAFGSLSFPQPEGGIVTVVYPIVFSHSS